MYKRRDPKQDLEKYREMEITFDEALNLKKGDVILEVSIRSSRREEDEHDTNRYRRCHIHHVAVKSTDEVEFTVRPVEFSNDPFPFGEEFLSCGQGCMSVRRKIMGDGEKYRVRLYHIGSASTSMPTFIPITPGNTAYDLMC